jgi:murein DD-endopeptidase MepM/ murein hydrolase activator NlpD
VLLAGLFLEGCGKNAKPAPVIYKGTPLEETSSLSKSSKKTEAGFPVIEEVKVVEQSVESKEDSTEEPVDVSENLLKDQFTIHLVQKGETLQYLTKKYYVSSDILISLNHLNPPYILKAGQRLRIPLDPHKPFEKTFIVHEKKNSLKDKDLALTTKSSFTKKSSEASSPILLPGERNSNSVNTSSKSSSFTEGKKIVRKDKKEQSIDRSLPLLVKDLKKRHLSSSKIVTKKEEKTGDISLNEEKAPLLLEKKQTKETREVKKSLVKPKEEIKESQELEFIRAESVSSPDVISFEEKKLQPVKKVEEEAEPSASALGSEKKETTKPEKLIAETDPSAASKKQFLLPIQGRILMGFGMQQNGFQNEGINIAAPKGAMVHAAADGVVAYCGNELKGFGNLVLINHADGWMSAYAHMDRALVQRGQSVKRKDPIGIIGKTGSVQEPQLHFELRHNGITVNPQLHT